MVDPSCCGYRMAVVEYDSDSDEYVYVCVEDPAHSTRVTDEDEV